ncbi:tRNA-Thr(GGU) m(6)t(6)A37 methyltransferase TsaA [Chromohalobacter marismortui]|uniref:tRNA-Thr(GGU) m(6)t(6)A37 methyltransferase TsaA n=1 Tax=Chromohalobacter marismortui TaxID=42055 RepID=A0A4R7NGI0_9GAMM|nr:MULTISPECIES: tRNA (N6-threonylcarbamoyladenosine(37)-N6)-methyltransferase TrmO [Chromohalobacter]MCI0509429.1 tRNA (N6-threonylcarbamoyladenosine(37)-N6)-methyltransferase TrmO [Chromohalobacter sp.]MCI0593050.1 tRNA (N6-threonylcarbamoyladenosine(37)-N6)-methyltransferase TrmO [Chromohalobacter sp.]TDU19301.1 tRNA-Thr(GGU) m(6)t(6)A37 methyltransferase TsaA [Chromohalobacter marismortui]
MTDCDFSSSQAPSAFTLTPIGRIASDYPDKFGIPRQPGLASAARATLTLTPPFDDPLSVRGLDTFSHLWLTFVFHHSPARWTPLVRPPRLGGNAKQGVFATRSTHRPNRLGLSLVELVEVDTRRGVTLHLRSHDLVDGTPVLDIKPYLAWAESRPEARSGFAPAPPASLPVTFSAAAEATLLTREDGDSLRDLIRQVLAQDPRPAYHKNAPGTSERRYGVHLRDVDVRFYPRTTDAIDAMHVEDIVAASAPA